MGRYEQLAATLGDVEPGQALVRVLWSETSRFEKVMTLSEWEDIRNDAENELAEYQESALFLGVERDIADEEVIRHGN